MFESTRPKSKYTLRQLPVCDKCHYELSLVLVSYKNDETNEYKLVEEWECFRCNSTTPRESLKEELIYQDSYLAKKTKTTI